MRYLALLFLLSPLPAFAAGEPSFDCAKAVSAAEKQVCADAGLSALDRRMGAVFSTLRKTHSTNAADLIRGQAAWLKERDGTCSDPNGRTGCLKRSYGARIAQLGSKEFLLCGPLKMNALAFTLSCAAINDPSHLSVALTGSSDGDKAAPRAHLNALKIARDGAAPQTLKVADGDIFLDGVTSALELMDVNFDGHDDIKLQTATSAGPNEGYGYWLYDPKSGRYAHSGIGDELSGFEIVPDPKTKTIRVSARGSCCNWNAVTYAWREGKLRVQTAADMGSLSLEHPPFKDSGLTACGTETDSYDQAGNIVSATFSIEACANPEGLPDSPADLFAFAQSHRKGFALRARHSGVFTIVYDRPIPAHE